VSVPPKKKPLAVPVIRIKIRASTPAVAPITGASIRSLRYHCFSNGSMVEILNQLMLMIITTKDDVALSMQALTTE
jgi:hypothetical protein